MSSMVEVECTHIEGELMRVRFVNSQLVSDHPAEWGGTGTGPAPGEMVLMALTSASALAGQRFAAEHGLAVAHVGSRATMNTIQEGVPSELRELVELPHLTYVDKFWRLLEFSGQLDPVQRDDLIRAMSDNRVAKTIEAGMEIEERVEFVDPGPGRARAENPAGPNHVLKGRERLPAGEKRAIDKKKDWNVSAAALDENACIVACSSALNMMADCASDLANSTPEEMLLAGLASCTTVYIARNASFHDMPLDDVRVVVRAEIPHDRAKPITKVEKIAYVTGHFSPKQAAAIEGFAGYCAFGLTLGRGAALEDSVAIDEREFRAGSASALAFLGRDAPVPDDPAYCNDGSCCVPAMFRTDA